MNINSMYKEKPHTVLNLAIFSMIQRKQLLQYRYINHVTLQSSVRKSLKTQSKDEMQSHKEHSKVSEMTGN